MMDSLQEQQNLEYREMQEDQRQIHHEKIKLQTERWVVELEESHTFQVTMDKNVAIMELLASTLKMLIKPTVIMGQ